MESKAAAKQPPSPATVANKAAATLLHFAIDLESSVSTGKTIDLSDLEHYTLRANEPNKFPAGALPQNTAHELESIGRRIWNTFLRKQDSVVDKDNEASNLQFYLRARLFSYLLLGIGMLQHPNANSAKTAAYLIRLGLALSKVCINHSDLEPARVALQKITEYLPSSPCSIAPAEGESPARSQADYASYYILRIALSWKDDRLDLAEHMYSKAKHHTPYIDAGTRATLLQVLTQVGQDLVAKSNLPAAAPWFRRAAEESSISCSDRNIVVAESEHRIHEQIRLTALQALVQCLIGLKSRESLKEASGIVAVAQAEFGERRVEALEMLVAVQAGKGDASDALTDLLQALLS